MNWTLADYMILFFLVVVIIAGIFLYVGNDPHYRSDVDEEH